MNRTGHARGLNDADDSAARTSPWTIALIDRRAGESFVVRIDSALT